MEVGEGTRDARCRTDWGVRVLPVSVSGALSDKRYQRRLSKPLLEEGPVPAEPERQAWPPLFGAVPLPRLHDAGLDAPSVPQWPVRFSGLGCGGLRVGEWPGWAWSWTQRVVLRAPGFLWLVDSGAQCGVPGLSPLRLSLPPRSAVKALRG